MPLLPPPPPTFHSKLSPIQVRVREPEQPLFEVKPRWKGAPKICIAANLPAFETEKEMATFHETNCPGGTLIKKWRCLVCNHIHVWQVCSDPAGASSGTTRTSKHKEHLLENLLNSELGKTIPKE